jgi:ribonuclease HI
VLCSLKGVVYLQDGRGAIEGMGREELKAKLGALQARQYVCHNKDRAIVITKLQYALDHGLTKVPSINEVRIAKGEMPSKHFIEKHWRSMPSASSKKPKKPAIKLEYAGPKVVVVPAHGTEQVTIYTDGSCKGNGKAHAVGGWSAILTFKDHRKELSGREDGTTNNRMEMMGVISGLEALTERCIVDIFTDSQYVKNGITAWINSWKRKGWKTKVGTDVKNRDLWERLDSINQKHSVRWHWVKGHADDAINKRADELANAAAA